MESLGYKCAEADNGQWFVDNIVEGRKYGLVLLDNEMPIEHGRDAIREVRD
jgi:CheY-like chemotaxis protein